jgi:uncharacterized protein with GYD domain
LNAARELAKKVGVEIKQVWLTNGESDLVSFVEAANGDNVAKFVLALGSTLKVLATIIRHSSPGVSRRSPSRRSAV